MSIEQIVVVDDLKNKKFVDNKWADISSDCKSDKKCIGFIRNANDSRED